jgi:integrating conjugative element protein (TIGR03757 family)
VKAALGSALLGAAGLLALAPANAAAPQVEVFVAPHQVERITGQDDLERAWPGVHILIFDLGAPQQFEDRLSAGLPDDPAQAQRLLEERIRAEDLEAQALAAFGGLLRAARLGLDRLPAVVFDDAAIVYGVTDLSEAAKHYARWRDGHE